MTRASVLLLALLILNILLGSLCLVVARGERRSEALRLWGLGMILYAAGILITLADFLPFDLRKILGNSLIAYAPVASAEGVLRHTRFRLHQRWVLVGLAASILPIVINHLSGHYQVLIDLLAPAPIANVVFLIAAVALLRDPPADAPSAARFLAAIFIYVVLVWTVRIALIVTSIGATNDRDRADLTIALFCIAQIVSTVAATLGLLWVEVRQMAAELRRQADLDALTGLANRRSTMRRFALEAARAARYEREFALLLFDIDHFKRVNDTYGHLAGDAVLRHVASLLQRASRSADLVGRIGGEEFVCLLGELHFAPAMQAANRLRELIESSPVSAGDATIALTVSGGLARFPTDGRDWDRLFAVADQRLYAAKEGGRNRIVGVTAPGARNSDDPRRAFAPLPTTR
jgi:diguanylate cyclase (GGDEF)-like protein